MAPLTTLQNWAAKTARPLSWSGSCQIKMLSTNQAVTASKSEPPAPVAIQTSSMDASCPVSFSTYISVSAANRRHLITAGTLAAWESGKVFVVVVVVCFHLGSIWRNDRINLEEMFNKPVLSIHYRGRAGTTGWRAGATGWRPGHGSLDLWGQK